MFVGELQGGQHLEVVDVGRYIAITQTDSQSHVFLEEPVAVERDIPDGGVAVQVGNQTGQRSSRSEVLAIGIEAVIAAGSPDGYSPLGDVNGFGIAQSAVYSLCHQLAGAQDHQQGQE